MRKARRPAAVRPRLSPEDVRLMMERRRSGATRFSRERTRASVRREAIREG